MPVQSQPTQLKIILAFAAVYIIWGSTFYIVEVALKSFSPFLLSALRYLMAGAALLIYCLLKKEPIPSWADTKKNMICGLVLFIGGIVSVVWAQQYISSSLASIVITTPFWFVILDKKQWIFYFSSQWIIAGLITGLVGVALLVGFKNDQAGASNEGMELLSILIIIASNFLWVSATLYLKYRPANASVYVNTSTQFLAAGFFCLVISLFRGEPQNLSFNQIRTDSLMSLFFLSLVSSLITFLAYIWLIKVRPPAVVSTYAYVNPLVAVLLGWGLAGESISLLQLAALVIILIGVLLVNIPTYKNIKQ